MTGSGTQADPYIPTTWAEFVTAIGTSGAYVSLAEGTVWDMNEIAPSGAGTVTVSATQVTGNGATIKNLYFNGGGFDFTANTAISNMKFTNVLAENSANVFRCHENQNNVYPSLSQVTISGKIVDSNLFRADYSDGRHQITTNRCAINVEISGDSAFAKTGSGTYPWLKLFYDNIKTTGSSTYSSAQNMQLQNTLWQGDWTLKASYFVGGSGGIISSNNIFDVNVPVTATVSVNSNYTANVKQCIFNGSKIASGATLAAQITQVTDEQLHSASYLNSIGFPIGVESS